MPDRNAAAHRVFHNACIFKELGYHVVFCGIDTTISANGKRAVTKIDTFDNYPMRYPNNNQDWIKQLFDFRPIKDALQLYDDVRFVVAYNMHAVPLRKLIKYCRKHKIKIIADATEWYENKFSLHPVRFIKWLDTLITMRVLQKRVDGMIAISSYLKNYYRKYIHNIIVVPPLIDVNDEKWHQVVEQKESRIEYVYSGTPGTAKDKLGQIVDCFAQIGKPDQYTFTVIGITEQDFIKTFPVQAEQLRRISDAVYFRGRIPHKDSIAALKRADYCIFIRDPSRKNTAGFPTKFVESYTSGINIIANEISDLKKYFPADGNSILLDTNTDKDIVRALDATVSKNADELRLSRRPRIENNPFDFRIWEKEFNKFLTGIINEKNQKIPSEDRRSSSC